jgi:hypothetical protein
MLVAQIAYNHLDPGVKAKCDALITVALTNSSSINSNFITAACWADDIKGSTSAYNTWHYIDIPFSLDNSSTNGVGTASFDVVRAINLCVSNLASTATTVTNQAMYLRFLLHFAGDIQQPLHCSTEVTASDLNGDSGGNSFLLNGQWNNLHSLWDAGGGYLTDVIARPMANVDRESISNKAWIVESHYPYNPNPGTIPNAATWAIEGWGLAKNVAYVGITNDTTPTPAYLATATNTTDQRMAAGGYRLADLLNALYSTNGAALLSLTATNGKFGFSWSAAPGRKYRIQYAPQLQGTAWTDLTNFTASSNSAAFSETRVLTQRFYRVVQ